MDEVAFLQELLEIPSPSCEEDAIAEHLLRRMTDLGLQAHRDGSGNVIGSAGAPDAERTIVLLGHMDTVPGLIPVARVGTRLYGRGAVDAKGPLAAFVLAAARIAPMLSGVRVLVIGTVEEERQASGARHLARTMQPPYCTIVGEPSHWEGITLGYKGSLSVDYRLLQPGGHSAGQQSSPAERAVAFWTAVAAYAEGYNDGRSGRFSTLHATLRQIHTFSDGLHDGVQMTIGVRIPPGFHTTALKQQMLAWSDGARLEFHPSDPPYESDKNTPLVRAMLRAIRAEGGRPRFKLKTGTSDMNVIGPAWRCPMVAYGPGNSTLDHTPNEHIEIEEYLRSIGVLSRALRILAA
jgi:LysW-gamma-L-lysine carboxypeptidase